MADALADKLDHPLAEVRLRALDSIAFKVAAKIIDPGSLVYDLYFLPKLFAVASWLLDSTGVETDSGGFGNSLQTIGELIANLYEEPGCAKRLSSMPGASAIIKQIVTSSAATFSSASHTRLQKLAETLDGQGMKNVQPTYKEAFRLQQNMTAPGKDPETRSLHFPERHAVAAIATSSSSSVQTPQDFSRANVVLSRRLIHPFCEEMFPTPTQIVQTFEYVHLSPVDEEIVSDFHLCLQQPHPDKIEEKLFGYLCIDIGAQIFLQRSQLLKDFLSHLSLEEGIRCDVSLNYLQNLVQELSKEFRRIYSVPVDLTSSSWNNSPNVSLVAPDSSRRLSSFDDSTSFPVACHRIFAASVPLLKSEIHFSKVVNLLYSILPMLVLHLELISKELNTKSVHDLCLEYILSPLEAIESQLSVNNDQSMAAYRAEKTFFLSVYAFSNFARLFHRDTSVWAIFVAAASEVRFSSEFFSILTGRLLESSDPHGAYLCNLLLTASSAEVQSSVVKGVFSQPTWTQAAFQFDFFLSALVSASLSDCGVQFEGDPSATPLASVVESAVASGNVNLSSRLMPWLLSYVDRLSLQLVQNCFALCKEVFTAHDVKILWSRGLFHKDLRVRQLSAEELSKAGYMSDVEKLAHCMVFNHVTSSSEDFIGTSEWRDNIGPHEMNDLISFLKGETVWSPELEGTLTGMTSQMHYSTLIDQAVQNQLPVHILQFLGTSAQASCIPESASASLFILCRNFLFFMADFLVKAGEIRLLSSAIIQESWLLHPHHRVRREYGKLLFSLLFCHYISMPQLGEVKVAELIIQTATSPVIVPRAFLDNYMMLCPVDVLPDETISSNVFTINVIDIVDLAMEAFLTQATVGSENTVAGIAATEHLVIDKLRSAQSHEEFSYALNELDSIAVGPDNFGSLFNVENGGILGRFLMVGPANSKDQLLLSKVLQFITRAQPQQECFFTQQTFQATFCNVLAPLLDSIAQTGQEATLPEIQLCENIISFIKAFTGAHLKLLRQDSSTFSVTLAALVNATKLMFILDKAKSASQKQKLDCLECLVTFSCVEEFVSLVSGKVGTNMIRLLVAILSYYQQNNMTTDGGNSFTYKDRSTYRLAALSLRNISRCIIVPNDSFAPFLWGDHWLLENDINWLQLLLNDDERMIQKFGLGILGNLILIKDSYHHLVVKFPQFLDMAFSYLLDHERSEQLRGEAALIINNFLITFCHDNKIAAPDLISGGLDFLQQEVPSSSGVFSASIPSDLPSSRSHNYHDPIHTSSRPWSSSSLRHMPSEQREKLATAADAEEKIAELLGIFDHCGFFERLHSILDSDFGSSSYRCALSELLLNLTLLAPTFMSNALLLGPSGGAWSVLIEFFTVTLHASAVSVHARAASLEQTPLLRHFCCRQQYHCDEPILSRMRTVILHICRLAVQQTGRSTAQYFVQETRLLNRIQILFASALRSLKPWPFNIKEVLADNEWIQLTMLLLADLLPEMLQPHKIAPGTNSILVEFLNESAYTYSGSNPPGSCGAVIMSVIAATVTGKASCCLLSRLLSLHFGEVVCLPMDELLQHNFLLPRTATAAPVTVGEVLTQELLAFASGPTFDKNDPVFAESLRLSLQCLLGRCEFAKTIALECGIPTALVGWADELLSQVGSKQEAHFVQGELNFIFSTLRHLFAGSISAKLAGQSAGIFIVISALLDSVHFDDIVMLEAMHCLQNAIANCMPPTQLLEPVPRSAKHSLLSRVLKRWCRSNTLDDVQVAAMEVLKICVLYPEARAHLLKDGLMDSLMSMLPKAYKARSTSKVEGLLCLLRNATNKSDGQLAVLKKSGMLAVIVDLMPISSLSAKLQVLSVLKNVASAKESKSYFLSEENFIPRLCTIMVATETEDLQDATLHLVWMLIWDCERMKAAFKRSGLNDIIRKMTRKDSMSALLPRQESSSEISSTGVNSEDIGSIGRKEMGHSVSAQIRRASAAVSRLLLLE